LQKEKCEMKKLLSNIGLGIFLFISLVVFYLTNTGVLTTKKPYIYQLSKELPAADPLVAFEHVNLIPMDEERIVSDQTVIVQEGVIETIGNSDQISIPVDAVVIDGREKYLMPGLVDMHVHIEYENDMLLLVANGVTSVRNMWGNTDKKLLLGMPDQLALRRQIDDDLLFGPTIYTTGPVMEGEPSFHPMAEVFTSPQEAAESVTWQGTQGFDFIKVYDHLSPEVYEAILDAARENELPVVGHVPIAIGIEDVLVEGQQTIEHLTGYIDPDAVEFIIPEDQLEAYAQKTREAGVWNVLTLSEYPKSKETPAGIQRLQNQPGMIYVSPATRLLSPFLYLMSSKSHTYPGADYPERIAKLNRQMVRALHEAGAGILLGTDAAQAYHLPGFAVHEELDMLVQAGLSPYEAIEAGTRNAAEVMGNLAEFGTIEEGKRADLIMLDNNPLINVQHLQERRGVMLRGRWLTEEQLGEMLSSLVESYKPGIFDRIWPLILVGMAVFLILRQFSRRDGERSND
jgi:imidazolonepropionase-like amidohydrolase